MARIFLGLASPGNPISMNGLETLMIGCWKRRVDSHPKQVTIQTICRPLRAWRERLLIPEISTNGGSLLRKRQSYRESSHRKLHFELWCDPIPNTGAGDPERRSQSAAVAPRNVFDLGVRTDNLLMRSEGSRLRLRFTVSNLTNKIALYNFLSTFSGTHFIAPRSYEGAIGFEF